MGTTDIAQGPFDVDVRQALADQLGSAMAAKMDNILREAVTRFLGRDDWTLGELKGRVTLQRLPNGVEVFCLDGVALVDWFEYIVPTRQVFRDGSTADLAPDCEAYKPNEGASE